MYRYAIIGFGGLGKLHLSTLSNLSRERGDFELAAICGADESAIKNNTKINLGEADLSLIDFSNCKFYSDYKELIFKEKPDFVLITLPTYLHEEATIYALSNGVHVFSEKPMALTADGCTNIIKAAKKSGRKLMIGHCLRFDSAYCAVKKYIESGIYGKAYRAEFSRYSNLPLWSWDNWILDTDRSGGCIMDMHVHDVDLINWYFGKPNSLRSCMTNKKSEWESVSTQYFYDDLLVVSNADWSMPQSFPFTARCTVNFEKATVVIENSKLTVYTDKESFSPELPAETFFESEIKAFISMIIDGVDCNNTSPESIAQSVEIALSEIQSATKGTTVCF